MSIKSLGISLWGTASSRSSTSSSHVRRDSQSSTTQAGFGLPSPEDPDPFGVKALELAGLEIKEAGSSIRPSTDAFDYRPSPTSPVFRHSIQSLDGVTVGDSRRNSRRNSKRNSKRSLLSITTNKTNSETRDSQVSSPQLPPRGPSRTDSIPSVSSPTFSTFAIEGGLVESPAETVPSTIPSRTLSLRSTQHQVPATIDEIVHEDQDEDDDEDDDEGDEFSDDEDIIIEEVSTSAVPAITTVLATPIAVKAKVISIQRRAPPALPLKSPLRPRFFESTQADSEDQDEISSTYSLSPDKSAFDKSEPSPNPWSEQTSLQDNESIRHKDSASFTGRDGSAKQSPEIQQETFEDVQKTTPVASSSDRTVPLHQGSSEGAIKLDNPTAPSQPLDLTPIATQIPLPDDMTTSEHKSSISGSTLASITDNSSLVKSGSEQSLANLIRQGLSQTLMDEDEYEDSMMKHYEEDEPRSPTSDYEDDLPSADAWPTARNSIPGAFVSEPLH